MEFVSFRAPMVFSKCLLNFTLSVIFLVFSIFDTRCTMFLWWSYGVTKFDCVETIVTLNVLSLLLHEFSYH